MPELLSDFECRVLGSLIEKGSTVPDTYPMTLNSLRLACNQKNSREPVMKLSDGEVIEAVDGLRAKGLARSVHQPGGRASKYKHLADEALTLDEPSLALLSVLLLRGPQTMGELRGRCERQFAFESVDDVGHWMERLGSREEPLVRLLPRLPGHKDARWVHLLAGEPDLETLSAPPSPAPARSPRSDEVAELNARLDDLQRRFDTLLERLGEEIP